MRKNPVVIFVFVVAATIIGLTLFYQQEAARALAPYIDAHQGAKYD